MLNISLGAVELQAAIVGLVTGLLYTAVRAPIPAPNVLGGILAIIGTFIGLAAVAAMRGQLTFG
jgi:XapX domain-containing protein